MVVRNRCSGWTTQELITALRPILPNFLLDEEGDGEVIVYTGLKESPSGTLEDIEEPA